MAFYFFFVNSACSVSFLVNIHSDSFVLAKLPTQSGTQVPF